MLRFGGRKADGRRVIGMILSRENVTRLQGGEPVYFDGATVGVDDVEVVIHVTDTPNADLAALVKEHIEAGGQYRPIEEVLEERAAVRAVGGDPDAEPTH